MDEAGEKVVDACEFVDVAASGELNTANRSTCKCWAANR